MTPPRSAFSESSREEKPSSPSGPMVEATLQSAQRATRIATLALDVPVAIVSLLSGLSVRYEKETGTKTIHDPDDLWIGREIAEEGSPVVLENLEDREQFSGHPVVQGDTSLDCILGIPLTPEASEASSTPPDPVGAMYVAGSCPEAFSPDDRTVLTDLASMVENHVDRRASSPPQRPLLEHIPVPVLLLRPSAGSRTEPTIEYANRAFTAVTGYPHEEVPGRTLSLLDGPKTDPDALSPVSDPDPSTASPFSVDIVNYGADGQKRFLQWNVAPIHEEDGALHQWIAVMHDGTHRRRVEEQVRERERKVEALYKETGDLLQADTPKQVAAHIEHLVLDTLGYPLNAVRFAENDRLVPARISTQIPDHMPDRPTYPITGDSVVARAFRSGETQTYEDIRVIDDGYDRGDARATAYIPLADHGIISVASLSPGDLNGFDIRLLEILAGNAAVALERIERESRQRRTIERLDTLRNISQSILSASSAEAIAEAALRRLESLVPHEQASVLECDESNGQISVLAIDDPDALSPDITERRLLEHFQAEDGTLLRDSILVEEIPDDTGDPVEQYLQSKGIHSYLNVSLRAESEVIGFLNLGTTPPDTYGPEEMDTAREVADMLAVALRQARYRDELIEAKEEAERMNRLKSAFLANMSHEIRTPLTSIVGFADVLTDYDLGEADRFTSLIERSGNQLLDTIDSVLDLSKLEAGSVDPTFEPTDVCQEITEAVELVRPRANENDVTVETDLPTHSLHTELDQSAFRRILQNLLSNAIKFTEAGGTITARARDNDDTIVVQVEDTGIGIDDEFMPNLFEAFEQEATSSTNDHTGTGLGLAVTKRLVELLNGTIEVESTKCVGTTFTVQIPA